jgi:hypothetical protein
MITVYQWFSTFLKWRHTFWDKKIGDTFKYPNYTQMLNYMYQNLKFKIWNYLAPHQKKLATHKCVATPWLRITAVYISTGPNFFWFQTDFYQLSDVFKAYIVMKKKIIIFHFRPFFGVIKTIQLTGIYGDWWVFVRPN